MKQRETNIAGDEMHAGYSLTNSDRDWIWLYLVIEGAPLRVPGGASAHLLRSIIDLYKLQGLYIL